MPFLIVSIPFKREGSVGPIPVNNQREWEVCFNSLQTGRLGRTLQLTIKGNGKYQSFNSLQTGRLGRTVCVITTRQFTIVSIPFKREGSVGRHPFDKDANAYVCVSIPFKREGSVGPNSGNGHKAGLKFQFPSNGKARSDGGGHQTVVYDG